MHNVLNPRTKCLVFGVRQGRIAAVSRAVRDWMSPRRAIWLRMAKNPAGGDGFGRPLAKKGLGSDEVWPKRAPAATIAK